MATKNIVPNADGEGQLGTSSKSWAQGHIDSITGTIATAAQGNITSLGTLTSLNISGGFTASSASTITVNDNTANLTLTCTDADATVGPMLFFKRDSASAATNDQIGTIFFTGRDAANSEDITYATIETHINESTDGQEGGKMTFKIASHDAESVAGLTLTDGDAEDEVDVTIASGTSSVTTISGNLKIPNDGTIGSAGTAGAITIDSSGIVGIGSTGIYAGTNAILNLQGSGIALKNDRNGSNNNWSYIQNDGTGSEATLIFSTGTANPALKLSNNGLLTMSPGTDSNPRITFEGTSVSGTHFIQLDRGSGASDSAFEVYVNGGTRFEVKANGNAEIADGNLGFAADGNSIAFGADSEVVLTHVHNNGLLLGSGGSYALYFRDTDLYINSSSDGELNLVANAEIQMTVPSLNIDANTTDFSGTVDITGNTGVGITNQTGVRLYVDAPEHALVARSNSTGYAAIIADNTGGSGTRFFISFRISNSEVGKITSTGSETVYATTSDYRLKENLEYTWDAITRLKQLKPVRFNFIADETNTLVDGFLAHEVQDIVPNSVSGEKDAVDSEGNPDYQGIDQSKLVPLLTKAIQEQQAVIEDLKSRIEVLEG